MKTINSPETSTQSKPALVKKIGKITYIVNVHFDDKAKEQLEAKLLKFIVNANHTPDCNHFLQQ